MIESKKVFEHIDNLTYEIGPRLAGGKRSKKAAEYIGEQFESFDLKTRFQDFRFVDEVLKNRLMVLILAGIFVVAPFLSSLYSFFILIAGYVSVYSLSWIIPKKRDRNVISRLVPEDKVNRKIIVGAHYDSARCVKSLKWIYFFKIGFPILLAAFLALSIFRFSIGYTAWLVGWIGILIPYIFLSGFLFWAYESLVSPGANDNASGVSVMLEVARVASEVKPGDTELVFVAFGGEEQNLAGSKEFSKEVDSADFFLNLDSLGSGEKLALVRGNGTLMKKFTATQLNKEIEDKISTESFWAPISYHDHIPFVEKGIKATTLTSLDPEEKEKFHEFLERVFNLSNVCLRLNSNIHTREDVPDNIKVENIERTGRLILELIGIEMNESVNSH